MTKKKVFHDRFIRPLGVVALAALALTACRAEEQNRMVRYEPGVYKGKADTHLTDENLDALRARARLQGGAVSPSLAGGGGSSAGSDVRPPSSDERAKQQGNK
ncbi:MAG: hypothetical protein VW268_12940 [Rhodospirillaceae bacterium]